MEKKILWKTALVIFSSCGMLSYIIFAIYGYMHLFFISDINKLLESCDQSEASEFLQQQYSVEWSLFWLAALSSVLFGILMVNSWSALCALVNQRRQYVMRLVLIWWLLLFLGSILGNLIRMVKALEQVKSCSSNEDTVSHYEDGVIILLVICSLSVVFILLLFVLVVINKPSSENYEVSESSIKGNKSVSEHESIKIINVDRQQHKNEEEVVNEKKKQSEPQLNEPIQQTKYQGNQEVQPSAHEDETFQKLGAQIELVLEPENDNPTVSSKKKRRIFGRSGSLNRLMNGSFSGEKVNITDQQSSLHQYQQEPMSIGNSLYKINT